MNDGAAALERSAALLDGRDLEPLHAPEKCAAMLWPSRAKRSAPQRGSRSACDGQPFSLEIKRQDFAVEGHQ